VLHLPMPSASFSAMLAVARIDEWLGHLDPAVTVSLSHLTSDLYDRVRADHPERSFRLRAGTSLWHGDKSFLHLQADVLEVRPITMGEPVGYRQTPAAASGTLVMVGAGSAHGIALLDGDLSPFHHDRRRLPLVEPPHMHTSMVVVTDRGSVPVVGDWVDVQRPLITVTVDDVAWR
jgi:alanine racemase